MEQRCSACGAPFVGKKCEYCGAKQANPLSVAKKGTEKAQESQMFPAPKKERRVNILDGVIFSLGVFFLFLASTGIISVLHEDSEFDHTFESEFPLILILVILGAVLITWTKRRKKNRK